MIVYQEILTQAQELEQFLAQTKQRLATKLTPRAQFICNLIIEELVQNAWCYGQRQTSSPQLDITWKINKTPQGLGLTIIDDAQAFNSAACVQNELNIDKGHGNGLKVLAGFVKSWLYSRNSGKNINYFELTSG